MMSGKQRPTVEIRIPGSQNFTRAQIEAIESLRSDLEANGYHAKFPIRKTASVTQATLDLACFYLALKADGVTNRFLDGVADIGVNWFKDIFAKNPRKPEDEPRTTRAIIYGADDKPVKEVEVTKDNDIDEV
jgi:hypothetical protein